MVQENNEITLKNNNWLFLGVILIFAFLIRLPFLFQVMAYDEAYTFLNFVNKGFSKVFYYSEPNNHVLHTILVYLTTRVLPGEPWVIRLPALFAGLACIPLVYLVCQKINGSKTGLWAALGIAFCPYLINYSVDSRGYSLMVCCVLMTMYCGLSLVERLSWKTAICLGVSGALGMFTIPSMLLCLFGLYLWLAYLLLKKQVSTMELGKYLILISGGTTIALTALLYAPVIWVSDGVDLLINNPYVKAQPWSDFFKGLPNHFKSTYFELMWSVFPVVQLLILALVIFGLIKSYRHNKDLFSLLPILVLGGAIVLIVKHRIPFARTWVYFIPLVLIIVDYAMGQLTLQLSPKLQKLIVLFILFIGVSHSFMLVKNDPFLARRSFPEVDQVAYTILSRFKQGDGLSMRGLERWPFTYHVWKIKTYEKDKVFQTPSLDKFYAYFVILKNDQPLDPRLQSKAVLVFDHKNVLIYQVPLKQAMKDRMWID